MVDLNVIQRELKGWRVRRPPERTVRYGRAT